MTQKLNFMITVVRNRPYYSNLMLCYCVEWKDEQGFKDAEYFNTYQEGIEFLKLNFPEWFAKHFTKPTKN